LQVLLDNVLAWMHARRLSREAFRILTKVRPLAALTLAQLVSPSLFPSVAAVNGAIQDAVALLRVPRSRLGIVCSSRGAAAGLVHLRDGPGGVWVDCGALGMAGWSIPGDIAAVERLSFR
jgi:hypothetical protein